MQTENATMREVTEEQTGQTQAATRLDGLQSELDTESPGVTGPSETLGGIRGGVADGSFRFDKSYVKHDLEEVVLGIIATEGMTHGKGVMEALSEWFDSDFSSGTVYPSLHDMEGEGMLERHELVRTKQYDIADEERALGRLESALEQHRTMAAFLEAVLANSR